jgi:hypothetical protein
MSSSDGLHTHLMGQPDNVDKDALKLSYLHGRITHLSTEVESLKTIIRFNFAISMIVFGSMLIYFIGWAWRFIGDHSHHMTP